MSILVNNIRIPLEAEKEEAFDIACHLCEIPRNQVRASVYRESLDARRGTITRVLSVLLDGCEQEKQLVERRNRPDIRYKEPVCEPCPTGGKLLSHRPIVVGFGPAGLFAAYLLAKNGYRPLVLERGEAVEQRDQAVQKFWSGGIFSENSNIQFGEGGAGAYSDGKLTTRIHDPLSEFVLHTLHQFGAPEEILTKAKPHIGTDILKQVVRSMREEIRRLGGEVRFQTTLTSIVQKNGRLTAIRADGQEIPCEQLIIAIGHSARDTFLRLHEAGLLMEPKPFSVGARIEHLQEEIDRARYGKAAGHPALPPAEYTLSNRQNGRACYSFCMCPGGQVVAAQSEEHTVVTNGMSYHARDGKNANAAVVVSVGPEDFDSSSVFAGMEFQRQIEQAAYHQTGSYRAPCQRVGDFLEGRPSRTHGVVRPTYPLGVDYGTLEGVLPEFVLREMRDGLRIFGRKIRGYDAPNALLTGPETRTSSPIRLVRGEDRHSIGLHGVIPCGEGAGYAGGIMSAAVDGLSCAAQIMKEYRPFDD
jgi:hypothetical protein